MTMTSAFSMKYQGRTSMKMKQGDSKGMGGTRLEHPHVAICMKGHEKDMCDPPSSKSMRVGGGGRFAALKSKLSKRPGVTNPGALAAYIGKKKYGAAKMAKMSAAGRHR